MSNCLSLRHPAALRMILALTETRFKPHPHSPDEPSTSTITVDNVDAMFGISQEPTGRGGHHTAFSPSFEG